MQWGRSLLGVVVAVAGAAAIVAGISLAAVTDEGFGDLWHPHGSLGLAVATTGAALVVIGGWVAVAPTSAWRRPWRWLDRTAPMVSVGLALALSGLILWTFVEEAGGFVMYYPYDFTGLELLVLGLLGLARGGWRLRHPDPAGPGTP